MRLLLACVGRSKAGPERELVTRYIDRAAAAGPAVGFLQVELREIDESRAMRSDARKREEARALGRARDEGSACAAFALGGPDGLDPEFAQSAALALSLGSMTWPHQLARILAAEQIYRAITILAGHPYHRD